MNEDDLNRRILVERYIYIIYMKGNGANEIERDKDRYTHPPKYQIIKYQNQNQNQKQLCLFWGGNGIQSWDEEEEEERRRRSWKFLKQPKTD